MTNDDNNLPSSTSKISSVKNSSSSNLQSYFETSGDQRTPSNISLKEVVFFTGNTAVDQTITHGILHLYRSKKSYGFRDRIEYDEDDDDEEDQEDCSIGMDELGLIDSEMILLYSIPFDFTLKDLLSFLGSYKNSIINIQILQAASSKYYMALANFKNSNLAKQFYRRMNHVQYTSLFPDIYCNLFFVQDVKIMAGIPLFDPEKMFELPQCPICIERLEEPVEGLNLTATILCNHTFHANCLVPWDDNSCPTCRCISTPVSELENTLDNNLTRSYADISKKSPQKVVDSRIRCHQCERERKLKRQRNQKSKSKNDNNDIVQLNESKSELTLAEEFDQLRPKSLQICLICGHIGCNFYEEKHAEKHYQETGHTYAMDLADGTKVWDYASQKFVHRLLTAYDESAGDNSTAKIVEIDPIMPVCHDDSSCSPNRNNTNNNHHFSLNDFHQHDEKGNCSLYASTSRCREQRRQNNIRPLDWAMEDDNEKITFHELKNNPSKEDKYCKLDQAQDAQISLIQIQCVKLLSHQLEQQRVYWQNRLKEVELKRLEDRETLEVLYEKEMSENFQTVGGDRNQTNMDNGDRRTAFQETENMLHQIDKEYIQIYEREKRMKNNNNNLLMIKNTAETQTQTEPQKDPKDLEREKFEKLQKDYDKLKENFSKCLKNLQTEKQMSETISKNYKILEDKNYNLSKEVEELSSSNRDLLMHFSVAENEKLQGEIEGGSIETKSSNSKGRRRKKK